jgi:hypothetical protein
VAPLAVADQVQNHIFAKLGPIVHGY